MKLTEVINQACELASKVLSLKVVAPKGFGEKHDGANIIAFTSGEVTVDIKTNMQEWVIATLTINRVQKCILVGIKGKWTVVQ